IRRLLSGWANLDARRKSTPKPDAITGRNPGAPYSPAAESKADNSSAIPIRVATKSRTTRSAFPICTQHSASVSESMTPSTTLRLWVVPSGSLITATSSRAWSEKGFTAEVAENTELLCRWQPQEHHVERGCRPIHVRLQAKRSVRDHHVSQRTAPRLYL